MTSALAPSIRRSRTRSSRLAAFAVILFSLALAAAPAASSITMSTMTTEDRWPHFFADGSGHVTTSRFEGAAGLSFELAWKRPLGSGYSSVVVQDGRLYTMASESERDWLFSLDAQSGEELFRVDLGPRWVGRSGSSDGATSSPTLAHGAAYVLTPAGALFAVDLEQGTVRWRKDLAAEFAAHISGYGYSTVPLAVGDVLLVQVGNPEGPQHGEPPPPDAEPGGVVAFDPADGRMLWRRGRGRTRVQSPLEVSLGGRDLVVSATDGWLTAIDPELAEVVWEAELDPPRPWGTVSLAGPDELVVSGSRGTSFYDVAHDDGTWRVERRWETNVFRAGGQNPRMPIHREGHLFAHTGRFLAAVDARTGEYAWRSRPPGGDSLIGIDDHLVMVGTGGDLVAVRATAEAYVETGRLPVFDQSRVYTPPTYADGLLFVRDLADLAAVRVRPAERPRDLELPAVGSTTFRERVSAISRAEAPAEAARRWLEELSLEGQGALPWQDEGWLHFLYLDERSEVALQGDFTGWWPARSMHRVEGTDLFVTAVEVAELDSVDRVRYRFLEFEEGFTDPRNPAPVVTTPEGEFSVWGTGVSVPEAEGAWFELAERTVRVGERDVRVKVLETLGGAEAAAGDQPPLLVLVPRGREALEHGHLDHRIAALAFRGEVPKIKAVFFDFEAHTWWSPREALHQTFTDVADTLLREDPRLRRDRVVVLGTGDTARYLLLLSSEFAVPWSAMSLQSPELDFNMRSIELPQILADLPTALPVWIDWGTLDGRRPGRDMDIARDAESLAARLAERGNQVRAVETPGGYDWVRWAEQVGPMLRFFAETLP